MRTHPHNVLYGSFAHFWFEYVRFADWLLLQKSRATEPMKHFLRSDARLIGRAILLPHLSILVPQEANS